MQSSILVFVLHINEIQLLNLALLIYFLIFLLANVKHSSLNFH